MVPGFLIGLRKRRRFAHQRLKLRAHLGIDQVLATASRQPQRSHRPAWLWHVSDGDEFQALDAPHLHPISLVARSVRASATFDTMPSRPRAQALSYTGMPGMP
jgi:hypothetical protein